MGLIRGVLIVGAGMLAARLSGFVRDVLMAAVLGAGAVTEAYVAGFLLPNLVRRTFGEGALNTAFVPILARRQAAGTQGAFLGAALGGMGALAFALALAGLLAMPALIGLVAPGFRPGDTRFADAVLFGRVAFVFVAFILLTATLAAALNATQRFAVPAFAGFILNGLLIAALGLLLATGIGGRTAALVLAGTVAGAGCVQLAVVALAARRAGLPLRPRLPFGDGDVARLLLLALPGAALAGAAHVNLLLAAVLSSQTPSAVAWLYYADRLFQLPLGFVAAAIGIVLLPALAKAWRSGEQDAARETFYGAMQFALLLALPAAAALVILAEPVTDVFYRRGAFAPADSDGVAAMLRALAVGLPAFALLAVLLPAYAARERLRLPLLALCVGLAANLSAAFALRPFLASAAAPMGVAVAGWTMATLLTAGLWREAALKPDAGQRRRLLAALTAAAGTALAILIMRALAAPWLAPAAAFASRALALALLCLGGVAIHALLALLLGAADRAALTQALRRAGS